MSISKTPKPGPQWSREEQSVTAGSIKTENNNLLLQGATQTVNIGYGSGPYTPSEPARPGPAVLTGQTGESVVQLSDVTHPRDLLDLADKRDSKLSLAGCLMNIHRKILSSRK
jgi:hypothetical protein